jgi:hypothetical protein
VAVAYDSVGPSASGAGSFTSPLTFSHTTVAASTWVLVAGALDGVAPGVTATCTLGGTTMTQVGSDVPSGSGGTSGVLRVWQLSGVAAGAHSIVITCSTASPDITGGSIAFSGAGSLGTPATNAASANGTTAFVTLASNTSGNLIAAFIGAGNTISGVSGAATSRFVNNLEGGSGAACGNAGGVTNPATGSSVTSTWTCTSTVAATMAVEVIAALTGANPVAVLATGNGNAPNASIVTSTITVGPRYAAAAADLGGAYGAWNTPQYAEGGP